MAVFKADKPKFFKPAAPPEDSGRLQIANSTSGNVALVIRDKFGNTLWAEEFTPDKAKWVGQQFIAYAEKAAKKIITQI